MTVTTSANIGFSLGSANNRYIERFAGSVTDSGRVIFTIAGRDFFGAVKASLLDLNDMTDKDIAKILSTSVKYAEILKGAVTTRLTLASKLLDPYCEFAPGVYIVDGEQFVTGVILRGRRTRKSKKARLLNMLPIGSATIHKVSNGAVLGNEILVRELLPSTGPLIFVGNITWRNNYYAAMIAYDLCVSNKLKSMDKYAVIPCSDGPIVAPLTRNLFRTSYCREENLPTNTCQSIEEIEKIVARYGSAMIVLHLRRDDLNHAWLDLFMNNLKLLCDRWPVKVCIHNTGYDSAGSMERYGIKAETIITTTSLLHTAYRYCRGAVTGHQITSEEVKLCLTTVDTTAGAVAEDLGADLSKIVFLTNHASKKQPSVAIADSSIVMTVRNPKAGIMFTWAKPNKKVRANTRFLVLPVDPRLAFASL